MSTTTTPTTRATIQRAAAVAERMNGHHHAVRAEFLTALEAAYRGDRAGTDAGVRRMQARATESLRGASNPSQHPAEHLTAAAVYADAALVLWRLYVHGPGEVTG